MTRVADDVLGRLARQLWDVFERVRKGSLLVEKVLRAIKQLRRNRVVNVKGRKWEEMVRVCGCEIFISIQISRKDIKQLLVLGKPFVANGFLNKTK